MPAGLSRAVIVQDVGGRAVCISFRLCVVYSYTLIVFCIFQIDVRDVYQLYCMAVNPFWRHGAYTVYVSQNVQQGIRA